MNPSILVVRRATFSLEDPWHQPEAARSAPLVRTTDGQVPRLSTVVTVYHDTSSIFVLFKGEDDEVFGTLRGHDEPLYQEDVVEIFLAPERIEEYFEIEVNPIGSLFDARIHSPALRRESMKTDLEWNCAGIWRAVRRSRSGKGLWTAETIVALPFESLGRTAPVEGESWRGNFYRIDRSEQGHEFSAWRPTLRDPADFHLPEAFGTLLFEG